MNEQSNSERKIAVFGLIVLIIGSCGLVLNFWLWSNGAYPYDNPIPGFNLFGIVVTAIPLVALVVMALLLIVLYIPKHTVARAMGIGLVG